MHPYGPHTLTRRASASVGAQLHCARIRMAHTHRTSQDYYFARRAYTLDSPTVPTQEALWGDPHATSPTFEERFSVHIQPSYSSYGSVSHLIAAQSVSLVGAQLHCARIRMAHTRFCSATITSYACMYFGRRPSHHALAHTRLLAGDHHQAR